MKSKNPLLVLIRYLLFPVIGITLITAGIWIIAISEDTIREALTQAIGKDSLRIEVEGLNKGIFYSLDAKRVILKSKDKKLIFIEDVSLRMNPLYLFLLRHRSSFNGRIQNGIITGDLDIRRNNMFMNLKCDDVDIKNIPYLKDIGFKGEGILDADIVYEGTHGNIKFAINNARFEPLIFSGVTLPVEVFDKARGMVDIEADGIKIGSLSFEGNNIYGRIKGSIKNNQADLTVEIMPEASAEDKFSVLMFIDKYKISPGYYLIPIKTNISF